MATGRSAAHVSARDSNIFTVSVNVEPEAKATFHLSYEELLRRKNNQYEIVININPGQIIRVLDIGVSDNFLYFQLLDVEILILSQFRTTLRTDVAF